MQSLRTVQPSKENPGYWELVDRKEGSVTVYLTHVVANQELRKRERLERDANRARRSRASTGEAV